MYHLISLTMEALSTSETSLNLYQTTWRNNTEARHLHTRRRENLKSNIFDCNFTLISAITYDPHRHLTNVWVWE
jgi:hypothetical protein